MTSSSRHFWHFFDRGRVSHWQCLNTIWHIWWRKLEHDPFWLFSSKLWGKPLQLSLEQMPFLFVFPDILLLNIILRLFLMGKVYELLHNYISKDMLNFKNI